MTNEVEELREQTKRAITGARVTTKERQAIHKLCDALDVLHKRLIRLEGEAETGG